MERENVLSLLGKVQLDLVNRKKSIISKMSKLKAQLNEIESGMRHRTSVYSYSNSLDRNYLKKEIYFLEKKEKELQLEIDAIMYARKFIKEHGGSIRIESAGGGLADFFSYWIRFSFI